MKKRKPEKISGFFFAFFISHKLRVYIFILDKIEIICEYFLCFNLWERIQ